MHPCYQLLFLNLDRLNPHVGDTCDKSFLLHRLTAIKFNQKTVTDRESLLERYLKPLSQSVQSKKIDQLILALAGLFQLVYLEKCNI